MNSQIKILQLCKSTLESLDISFSNITGENLSEFQGTLPCLTNLDLNSCEQLTYKGLLQILQLCGSTLESLDISYSYITGENISEYNETLPRLTKLNMSSCELTDKGLLQTLQLCGSTLKSLNISDTSITGENISVYNGTLPWLMDLNLESCKQLTDRGLLQILQLCGSTLKSLNVSECGITSTLGQKIQKSSVFKMVFFSV